MTEELILSFPNENQVTVEFAGDRTAAMDFAAPLTDADRDDIRWYLEVYGTQYTIDLDDDRAGRIAGKFKAWGEALFDAALSGKHANRLFWKFYDNLGDDGGLITIDAGAPALLSLPWELLCMEGKHLVHEDPHVSVRRRLTGAGGTGRKFTPESKETLHLLFVVSRPKGAGFIDPRADAMAVMDALEENAPGRVTVEFLRPATLWNLDQRLKREGKYDGLPAVDILHFDGHGVFDPEEKTGCLLFENRSMEGHRVPAEVFGNLLSEHEVPLVVLSACQSAKLDEEEPLSGVGARLIHSGVPSVIAMDHTVLVSTTRLFFGSFYAGLSQGKGVGGALEAARNDLYQNPVRGERRRGEHDQFILELYDWFLPSLYQDGEDVPLLTAQTEGLPQSDGEKADREADTAEEIIPGGPVAGFYGRSVELWQIERFLHAGVRRITVTGFGGQGKTALAGEAGPWLVRSGMFRRCCFVSFAAFQGVDPLAFAVSSLSVALDRSLIDAAAESALAEVPTLVILDNLESLSDGEPTDKTDRQPPLLDAAARWSRAGESRVLITTRQPKLDHPEFPAAGSREHQYLGLSGLAEHDAVRLFAALWELPPDPEGHIEGPPPRHGLVELFQQVDFHPLSIGLLAYQLKSRRAAELGERLESLLKDAPGEGAEKNLRASLDLSLERLPEEARKWLPRLGVFRGGGVEDVLVEVTNIFDWVDWSKSLEANGLIRKKRLPGIAEAFWKFHPALSPYLWERMPKGEKKDLCARHRAAYYRLSDKLQMPFTKDADGIRCLIFCELPNLFSAVKVALAAGDQDAVSFVDNVNFFLYNFGLFRERDALGQRAETVAGYGTKKWYISQEDKGHILWMSGRNVEAEKIFRNILDVLGDTPSFRRRKNLIGLGRCLRNSGRLSEALAVYREGITMAEKLETTENIRRQTGVLQNDKANTLRDMGNFPGARAAYEAALEIATSQGDGRQICTLQFQLLSMPMMEGGFLEAERRHGEALHNFRRLQEPSSEAVVQQNLGILYFENEKWDAAEGAFRESARLKEGLGNLAGAANTYNSIGAIMEKAGHLSEAEVWYRKAMKAYAATDNVAGQGNVAHNLARLLLELLDDTTGNDDIRFAKARTLAKQALAIKTKLDPGVSEIWNTYSLLADIAEKQGEPAMTREYRRLARETKIKFMGTQHEVVRFRVQIEMMVKACKGEESNNQLNNHLAALRAYDPDFVEAAIILLAGERDEEKLFESLSPNAAAIIGAVLARLRGENPYPGNDVPTNII